MKRIKLLTLLMLCIVAIHADETLEIINIEIDISWNSTSVNSSAEAPVNSAEMPFSTDLNATLGRTPAAVISSGSGGPTSTFTQPLDSRPSVGTQIDSFMPTGSSWPGYQGLTGSASTASQSTGLQQPNNSLWASGSLRPTAQVSPSSFSGKASVKRISKEEVGLLIILGCVTGMFL